ncbi:MAG: protein O-mannosyl-transferase family, partial [Pseudomonadota bacterium]
MLLFFLGSLLVVLYAWTGPQGTTPEDASEFILTAFFKGLPHPPGYPLFVWLGHLCSYIPWGSPAQKISFLSYASMAGSAV